jgi:hypothetical protein
MVELNGLTQKQPWRLLNGDMYSVGLDVHRKTISYCVKGASGCNHQEGKIAATQREPDC